MYPDDLGASADIVVLSKSLGFVDRLEAFGARLIDGPNRLSCDGGRLTPSGGYVFNEILSLVLDDVMHYPRYLTGMRGSSSSVRAMIPTTNTMARR